MDASERLISASYIIYLLCYDWFDAVIFFKVSKINGLFWHLNYTNEGLYKFPTFTWNWEKIFCSKSSFFFLDGNLEMNPTFSHVCSRNRFSLFTVRWRTNWNNEIAGWNYICIIIIHYNIFYYSINTAIRDLLNSFVFGFRLKELIINPHLLNNSIAIE